MFFGKTHTDRKPSVLSREQRELAASAGAQMRRELERYIVLRVQPAFYRSLASFYDTFDAAAARGADTTSMYETVQQYEVRIDELASDLHHEALATLTTMLEIADFLDHREGVTQMMDQRIGVTRDTVHQLAFESFAEFLRVADPEQFKQLSEVAGSNE